MTNKEIIRKVIAGFEADDLDAIMEHLADDVRCDMVGQFTVIGKDEYRKKQKPNQEFILPGTITILNEIEDGDTVAVEGVVKCKMKNGTKFEAFFSDFFKLENGKIKEMRFYVIPKNKPE
jgi:ketosteroid isomerase-like protein